jgi:hypothetical protein
MRIAVATGISMFLFLAVGCSSKPPANPGDPCNGDGGELLNYCIGGELLCIPPGTCRIACPLVTLTDGGYEGLTSVDAGCPGSETCQVFDTSIGYCQ